MSDNEEYGYPCYYCPIKFANEDEAVAHEVKCYVNNTEIDEKLPPK